MSLRTFYICPFHYLGSPLKAVSDDTIFAPDCLRFASRGVGNNLTQSCAIRCNRMESYLIRCNREESGVIISDL